MHDLHVNGGVSALSISDQCDHPCAAGKAKVLKRLNDELKDLQVFCISLLLCGFKKTGERGHLIMHIIWGYIQSLGFKLLDERLPWINVIFPLAYGHLLRVREKAFACAFTVNNLYYCSFSFIVLLKPLQATEESRWLGIVICGEFTSIKMLWHKRKVQCGRGVMQVGKKVEAEKELICRARQKRRGQTLKGPNRIHLLTCSRWCLVDVLLLWWGTYVHSSCATINRQWLCAS